VALRLGPLAPLRALRLAKVRAVARFELAGMFFRKAYLITTFGMPVILLLYGLLISIPAYFASKKGLEPQVFGLVDLAGVLDPDLEAASPLDELPDVARVALERLGERNPAARMAVDGPVTFRPMASEEAARAALRGGETKGYFVVPGDYLASGHIDLVRDGKGSPLAGAVGGEQLQRFLRAQLVAGRMPEEVAARVRRPVTETRTFELDASGDVVASNQLARIVALAVPGGVGLLLFVSLMMTSGYLVQGTAEEKENRVVEVLLAAANPDEILLGKLLGLGAAGLFQTLVWMSMVGVAAVGFGGVLAGMGVVLPWLAIGLGLLFFVAGYLFLGSVMLATGSLGGNVKESQQWSAVWTILSVLPFVFVSVLLVEPHGTVGRVLTWVPWSAPLTVLLRVALDPSGIAWWEIAGAFVVLLLSTWAALRLGARLFRVGLLFTGSRPKLREILRQARLGD
jgi:ABC-2 type transport system permease protein